VDNQQGIEVFLWMIFHYLMDIKFTDLFIKISNVGTIYREMGIKELSKRVYDIQTSILSK